MTFNKIKTFCIFFAILFSLQVSATSPFDSDKPATTFVTAYSQTFNTAWDGFTFNKQWDMLTTFVAADIQSGYLKFTATKRNLLSKLPIQASYIITADIDYADGSNLGGVVIRGEQTNIAPNTFSNALGSVFCRDGIAFFPSADGANMTVHFTGALNGVNTTYTDILVPKPAGVTSLKQRGVIRIEDYETSVYVYYNDAPFIRINFGTKTGSYYSSGEVFDADMVSKGTFTAMEVIDKGRVAIVKNETGTEAFRLYSASIQTTAPVATVFDNDKPVATFTTAYSQMYNTTWDSPKFYSQWDMIDSSAPFDATHIATDFLQFAWPARRVLCSKTAYSQPYIFETDIDYIYSTNNGGVVIRAKANGSIDELQVPADGTIAFNREGIAIYPMADGLNMVIQFTGPIADPTTPLTKILVPKPANIKTFVKRGVLRVEDYGTSIYVYFDGVPLAKISLNTKVGNIYTSGEVFNGSLVSLGTFTGMEVEEKGKISVAQRLANIRLYSAEIQIATTNFDTDKPVRTFNTTYEERYNTTWDATKFYNQWSTVGDNCFDASDITNGYLQFQWLPKRIMLSKTSLTPPYIFQTDIDYGLNSNRGGVIIRAVPTNNIEELQDPGTGLAGFNRTGIAFYPNSDGTSMTIQFSGDEADQLTTHARINVPKPAGISSLLTGIGRLRLEDFGTTIYVYYDNAPFARINLSGKSGSIYSSGTVYDANMQELGTFTGMRVVENGKISVAQRDAGLKLHGSMIQLANPIAPSAPIITSIIPGDGQLTVEFTSGYDGGSPITNYEYTTDYGTTIQACSPAQTTSPIVITGLVNGTSYGVLIRALNAIGPGAASNWIVASPSVSTKLTQVNFKNKIYQSGSEILFDLQSLTGSQIVSIYDLNGENLITKNCTGGTLLKINNTLQRGVYIVKVAGSEKELTSKLIIK